MSESLAAARLLSLRVAGFKSFAVRTVVEFGPGISAVVGPNGSGKSNLADALRWVLGEQGRALRSRKSEDVIFAGSERRSALGMAEATLALDNSDGLLPVDYRVLELGRRLYRSGENEYLLNRQRIRLRDLVDLLDAANLADNAFLFIGQGMVDQALSLRPEERRPLFEEVAGVRRHERRRRKAEEELAEAESNLTRVEDIVAELRPQARRLAAMAEQQASREVAAEELIRAVLLAAHWRWHDAVARTTAAGRDLEAARREVDRAIDGLAAAERAMADIRAALGARAADERARRTAHDEALARLTTARIRSAEVATEIAAIGRDEARAATERDTAVAARAAHQRELALPLPAVDQELEAALRAAAAALGEPTAERAAARAADARDDQERRAARRVAAAQAADADAARRRASSAAAEATREWSRAGELRARHESLRSEAEAARAEADRAAATIQAAAAEIRATRAELAGHDSELAAATELREGIAGRLAATAGHLEALQRRRAEEEGRAIARAARRRGGRRVDDGLVVEPEFRAAVEAALGEAARGYLVDVDAVADLAGERGILVLPAPSAGSAASERARAASGIADLATDPRGDALRERLAAAGGGLLADAIRHDPTGAVRRLLALVAWLPDLPGALAIASSLPPGGLAVVRDGSAVVGAATVALGRTDGVLERRAEEAGLAAEAERLRAEDDIAERRVAAARDAVGAARARAETARRTEEAAGAERHRAEERERLLGREAEAAAREAAWSDAQAERLETEAARAIAALAALTAGFTDAVGDAATTPGARDSDAAFTSDRTAIAVWEERAIELRHRRDRLAAEQAEQERARREAERRRAATEAALAAAEERAARSDRELTALAERRRDLETESASLAADVEVAQRAEAAARAELARLAASDEVDRARLAEAERAALRERQQLRVSEDRSRRAEGADLQARLELDVVREQVLVELAGLGERGLRGLEAAGGSFAVGRPVAAARGSMNGDTRGAGPGAGGEAPSDEVTAADATAFEAALAAAAEQWAAEPPVAERPSPARLAWLRRRYHELGAANPFALKEYEEVRSRLHGLESQATDLRSAIERTRSLIAELNTLIADQFRSTFRALEVAFDRRFQQLFGGGFARLTLTAPEDLAATGVEIVARPPGKKAQPLAMLSGGERALTAVALLFAMLEVRPVPFCVLDEVDAALDEANVARFADALRGLAQRTQFIVITHNRGTIEAADALYGVTAGEDSVSRVISLRLEEATALAGSAGGVAEAAAGAAPAADAADLVTA